MRASICSVMAGSMPVMTTREMRAIFFGCGTISQGENLCEFGGVDAVDGGELLGVEGSACEDFQNEFLVGGSDAGTGEDGTPGIEDGVLRKGMAQRVISVASFKG